jgi:hypothetical protein
MVFTADASPTVQLGAWAVVVCCGVRGVRSAARVLPLVEELRADAEACRDEAARTVLRGELGRARTPTPWLATRIRVLDAQWAPVGLAAPRRALALSAGLVLPVLALFCLVWSGALTAAPDL